MQFDWDLLFTYNPWWEESFDCAGFKNRQNLEQELQNLILKNLCSRSWHSQFNYGVS